jgi:hypothetical protein
LVGTPSRHSRSTSVTSIIVTSRYITPPGSLVLGQEVYRAI